eukprot:8475496-Alexandrium_andersonii.AAC.1
MQDIVLVLHTGLGIHTLGKTLKRVGEFTSGSHTHCVYMIIFITIIMIDHEPFSASTATSLLHLPPHSSASPRLLTSSRMAAERAFNEHLLTGRKVGFTSDSAMPSPKAPPACFTPPLETPS